MSRHNLVLTLDYVRAFPGPGLFSTSVQRSRIAWNLSLLAEQLDVDLDDVMLRTLILELDGAPILRVPLVDETFEDLDDELDDELDDQHHQPRETP